MSYPMITPNPQTQPEPKETVRDCACCFNAIDMDLRKDNPLCDQCTCELHVDNALRSMTAAVDRMQLPFDLSITVELKTQKCRIRKTVATEYAVVLVNTDLNISVSGHARTAKEASDRALAALKDLIEKQRAMWRASAA
jgi:hypothetical protein